VEVFLGLVAAAILVLGQCWCYLTKHKLCERIQEVGQLEWKCRKRIGIPKKCLWSVGNVRATFVTVILVIAVVIVQNRACVVSSKYIERMLVGCASISDSEVDVPLPTRYHVEPFYL
jgi:hypothetical protein